MNGHTYSTWEVAEALGVSEEGVRGFVDEGWLRATFCNGALRFTAFAIREFFSACYQCAIAAEAQFKRDGDLSMEIECLKYKGELEEDYWRAEAALNLTGGNA